VALLGWKSYSIVSRVEHGTAGETYGSECKAMSVAVHPGIVLVVGVGCLYVLGMSRTTLENMI